MVTKAVAEHGAAPRHIPGSTAASPLRLHAKCLLLDPGLDPARETSWGLRITYWCLVGNGWEWMGMGEWDDYY